ncbi:hypothetical protein ACOSP7_029864 [Xanthoceras sorbifolium]
MIASAELESGTGANQIRSLQRAGPTRWSSHFTSVSRLIDMFGSTCTLLEKLSDVGLNGNIRGEAQCAYKNMRNFDFVHDIDIPNMGKRYMEGTRRSCQQRNNITVEHFYHFNIFNAVIDFHLMELNNRFIEKIVELLTLSEALNPIDVIYYYLYIHTHI